MYLLLKKYRGALIGLTMLWIMFYHSDIIINNSILRFIKDLGFGGVDILLICSGFGIAHSLKNNDVTDFFKRRVVRIYPTYFFFIVVYILFQVVVLKDMDVVEIAGALTLSGWWFGYDKQFNWYLPSLWMFYLIAPIIFGMLNKSKKPIKTLILIILYALLLCMACINYEDKIMAIGRIPVFIIGIYWGAYLNTEKEISKKCLILGIILCIFGAVFSAFSMTLGGIFEMLGMGVPFLMIAPGLCMSLPWLFNKVDRTLGHKVIQLLNIFGSASLEIYMIHIAIFKYVKYLAKTENDMIYVGLFVLSLVLGIIYHKIISIASEKVTQFK